MSLATFKKKTQATAMRRVSAVKNFSLAVTNVPANTHGVHAGNRRMGTGLGPRTRYGMFGNSHSSQPPKIKGVPYCVNEPCSARVPVVQKSYRSLYNSRKNGNCTYGSNGCNIVKAKNDDASLYIDKKRIKALKCKKCCGDTNVTLSTTGSITSSQTQFFAGCGYTFSWASGISSINGVSVAGVTSYSLFLPSELCDTNQVIIVGSGPTTNTYPVVLPPLEEENCAKINNCQYDTKSTNYVSMRDKCPTTKNLKVRSSSEQMGFIKAKRTAYVADPVPRNNSAC